MKKSWKSWKVKRNWPPKSKPALKKYLQRSKKRRKKYSNRSSVASAIVPVTDGIASLLHRTTEADGTWSCWLKPERLQKFDQDGFLILDGRILRTSAASTRSCWKNIMKTWSFALPVSVGKFPQHIPERTDGQGRRIGSLVQEPVRRRLLSGNTAARDTWPERRTRCIPPPSYGKQGDSGTGT